MTLKVLGGLLVLILFATPAIGGSGVQPGHPTRIWGVTAARRAKSRRAAGRRVAPASKRRCPLARAHARPGRTASKRACRRTWSAGSHHSANRPAGPLPAACCATVEVPPSRPATPTSASGPPASPSAPAPASAWDRPALSDPTTVQISPTNHDLVLDQSRDYVLVCPPGRLELPSKLSVWGGHDVVLENCDLAVSSDWVAYLHDQTGTLWIHDVHFGGTNLGGGIQLEEPGATVVMRDVLFDEVVGSYTTNHAELIQTWSGPSRLLIDGLSGSTSYQGLYLLPNQYYTGPEPTVWDLRNIDIDNSQGGYALWVSDQDGAFPLNVKDVWIVPNPAKTWRGWWLWGFGGQDSNAPGQGTWANVSAGAPPSGSYVHATANGAAGVDEGASPAPVAGEQP